MKTTKATDSRKSAARATGNVAVSARSPQSSLQPKARLQKAIAKAKEVKPSVKAKPAAQTVKSKSPAPKGSSVPKGKIAPKKTPKAPEKPISKPKTSAVAEKKPIAKKPPVPASGKNGSSGKVAKPDKAQPKAGKETSKTGKQPPKPEKPQPKASAPVRKGEPAAPAGKATKAATPTAKGSAAESAAPAATKTPAPAAKPAAPKANAPVKIVAEPTSKTPRQLHYRMPAEWEPHYATFLTWPNKKGISFPGKGAYDAVIPTFLSMIRALITSEEVFLNVSTEEDKQTVRDDLTIAEQRRVHFVDTPSMEPWCRDHGATFVVKDEGRLGGSVTWKFNAWGAKYDKALVDAQIGGRMAQFLGGKHFSPDVVLEGGAIEVNGSGTVLTTESCLLNKNRNKGVTKEAIERTLRDYLNVSNVLWLPGGLEGDDTDGHIDTITRFVNKNTVVTSVDDNTKDKNHAILQRNLELLKGMKIEDGSELQVVNLPMPAPMIRKGQRLPASYANFYIGNKIVLLPTYDDPADEKALEVMVKCFPSRRIYPIDARELIWGLGAFHCLTQQVPLAAFPKVIDLVRNPPPSPRPVY